jgi:hypothetical protein
MTMRTLTDQEKRTVRFAAIGIGIYLVIFGGFRVWKLLDVRRSEYRQMIAEANNLKQELQLYQDKTLVISKLMESSRMDPAKLSRTSLVAGASAAIQKAALTGAIQLGPIRESVAHSTASSEVASMQLEGNGPLPSVMAFLHNLESVGYPLILDSVQITIDPSRPGMVKLNLSIVILDFEQWKNDKAPNV